MAKRVTQKTDAAAPGAAEETVPAVVPEVTPDAPPEAVSAEASLAEPEAAPEPEEVPAPVVEELKPEDVAPEDPRPVDPPRAEPMLAAQPPLPEPQPGPGAGSLILGGVVAAVIGAGAALYAVPLLPPQLAGWVQAPQPDTAGINSVVSAQGARIDTLAATIESLKSAPPQVAAPSGLQAAIDESAANLRSLQEGLQALTDRVVALETRPVAQAAEPGPDLAALRADLETLRGRVDGLGNGQQIQDQIAAAAAQIKGEVEAAQGQAAQIGASVEAAAKRSLAQAAVARVGAAVQAGAPLAPALADAEAAGLSVPAALRADVPSLLSLQTSFPEAARPALKAARKAVAGSGIGERLGAFLIAQTGARSLTPHEGTDPDAVMSRAQAAVDAGDLARALQELGGLPEAGQAMMSGWITGAQKRIAAADAVAELAQSVK